MHAVLQPQTSAHTESMDTRIASFAYVTSRKQPYPHRRKRNDLRDAIDLDRSHYTAVCGAEQLYPEGAVLFGQAVRSRVGAHQGPGLQSGRHLPGAREAGCLISTSSVRNSPVT